MRNTMLLSEVRDFINDNCIIRVPPDSDALLKYGTGPKFNRPPEYLSWMFLFKSALYEPTVMATINSHFFNIFPILKEERLQLAGLEHASTPMITSFSLEAFRQNI